MRSADLLKWKRNVGVGFVHDLALGRPVGTNNDFVVIVKNAIERSIVEHRVAINGGNEEGATLRYTAHLFIETRHVEPMEPLGDGDRVSRPVWQPALLGSRDVVFNPVVSFSVSDLFGADVSAEDAIKVLR